MTAARLSVACLLLLCLVLSALRPLPASASHATAYPVPVLLDTDIGDDFDDMMALTYILSAPTLFDPLAIVVSTRNTTKRALLVAHTLRLANRTTVPIYVGTVQPDNGANHQYDSGWVPADFTLADYRAGGGVVYDGCGVCALVEWLAGYSGPAIHVVEIAPVTSLAAALVKQPSLASKLTVFAMNGEIDVGYGNQTGPEVEWNVLVDVPASHTMYAAGASYVPLDGAGGTAAGLITSPLDSTVFQQWDGAVWQRFLTYNNTKHPLASMLVDAYTHWYDAGGKGNGAILPYSPSLGTSTMYDAQAAYTAAHSTPASASIASDCAVRIPHLITACLSLYVNTSGYVAATNGAAGQGGANVSVVVGLEGGRSDPHPAALRIGAVVLSSIAGVDEALLLNGEGDAGRVVEVELDVNMKLE